MALQELPAGLASLSAQTCAACHIEICEAWAETEHAQAWRDPDFQAAIEAMGDSTACRSCHLPLANQHPHLAVGYLEGDLARPALEPNPAWDPTLMSEGVTCAACHVREGTVLGTRAIEDAPHPVVASEELGTAEVCAACHQLTWPEADRPFYDTYGEWRASAYAEAGVRCQDCHMPPRAGNATATRFAAQADHATHAEPARALTALVGLSGPEIHRGEPFEVELRLLNTGAGHHVPTGSPFKEVRLLVELRDGAGKLLADPYVHRLVREVEPAAPWRTVADSRLPAGEERTLSHTFEVSQRKRAGAAAVVVAMERSAGSGEAVDRRVLQTIPIALH